jgi:hypothetical protein
LDEKMARGAATLRSVTRGYTTDAVRTGNLPTEFLRTQLVDVMLIWNSITIIEFTIWYILLARRAATLRMWAGGTLCREVIRMVFGNPCTGSYNNQNGKRAIF